MFDDFFLKAIEYIRYFKDLLSIGERLRNQELYFDMLKKDYIEVTEFRHDYLNILSTISGYIHDNDIDGLNKYFYKDILILDNVGDEFITKGQILNLEIKELRGLMINKVLYAKKMNVSIKILAPNKIESRKIPNNILLARCLGIIIDNAIEAASKCDKPLVVVTIIDNNNQIKFIVENNYEEVDINLKSLYCKGFSTKGKGRGLGLYNVRKLLSKDKSILLNNCIRNNKFIQEINISEVSGGDICVENFYM